MKRILSLFLSLAMLIGMTTTPVLAEYPDSCITVPADASLFVGEKSGTHFVSFTEVLPTNIVSDGSLASYYFELTDNSTYNYRISGEDYVTYGGTFKKTADFSLTVTDGQLKPDGVSKTTVDKDTASNNGYNVADIYLNINPQGYLKLASGETKQIVSLRNWEAVNSTTANYFIEPDYHYEVTDENSNPSSVVTVDENGLITANESGTAIVLVTYDAMTLNFGQEDSFYGAVWPENTGVFVVSVDSGESGIQTGMTINEGKNLPEIKLSGDSLDAEHDCIYFVGNRGEYTFTPVTEGVSVSVANPTVNEKMTFSGFEAVAKNADNSFSVPLTNGRNIVKLEKDGKAEYQVITAKAVTVSVNNGEDVYAGDTLNISFDKLYHPSNKLAGVYNMNAIAMYTNVSGYAGSLIGGTSAQYNFANNSNAQTVSNVLKEKNVWGVINYEKDVDLVVPADYAYETFTLSGGVIYASGWGDSYGNHRAITYENGKGANLNADAKLAYFGRLPDIEITVTPTTAELESITLDTANVKTEYFAGDSFDVSNLVVTANYADGATQLVTNYTVTPEVLSSDTESVAVTYREKTAEIPVSVSYAAVTGIEITTPPTKTEYKEGEVFNPSGMVISTVHENGAKFATDEYAFSPDAALSTDDSEIVITYTGAAETAPVSLPITVSKKTGGSLGSSSDTITVYFTLLGDDNHGEPGGEADTHTKKSGNLKTWIAKTKLTVDKGSYVIDVVRKVLDDEGMSYTDTGDYISEINGLGALDNGSLSGWMYTLNGKYPTVGIDAQTLKNSDVIIFHYTDDYTAENNGYSSSGSLRNDTTEEPEEEIKDEADTEVKEEPVVEAPEFTESTFVDVSGSDWYYNAVEYAYENGLMQGTDKGFEPNRQMTRAELCAVLWRMENEPVVNYALSFGDVEENSWYTEAVRWGASEGIISGYSEYEFGTNDYLAREQIAAILYRYAQKKGLDTAVGENTNILSYDDAFEISEYAIASIQWAVGTKLMTGRTESTVNPTDTATRAEVAQLLMNFCELLKGTETL